MQRTNVSDRSADELSGIQTDGGPPSRSSSEQSVQRRITVIWILLLFNVLPPAAGPTVIAIPQRVGQLLTMGSLALAALLTLTLNRRLLIRPRFVLVLFTLLAGFSLMASVRGTAGLGAVLRSFRLTGFLIVLWLLTPWWGRRDLLLARCHLRAMIAVCATVILGLLVAPSSALTARGRLTGVLWPIWPTAVAHFAAVGAGMALVLWMCRSMSGRSAVSLAAVGITMVFLSHTRTAIIGMFAGIACAMFSILLTRKRARRVLTGALVVLPMAVVVLASAFSTWFVRGQSEEEIRGLTGRRQSWDAVVNSPRPEFNQWFGIGLTDKGFEGRPIDNGWVAIYQDQGLVGIAVVGAAMIFLIIGPAFVQAGPQRALALFIVVYCVIDSITEVGLGDASPYLLDIVVAASLVVPSADPP